MAKDVVRSQAGPSGDIALMPDGGGARAAYHDPVTVPGERRARLRAACRTTRPSLLALCGLLTAVAGANAAESLPAEGASWDRSALVLSIGAFDAADESQQAFEAGVQYRRPTGGWFHPIAGGMATSAGGVYAFLGLSIDVPVGRRVILRGSFAPGYYSQGSAGKDLGSPIEFRSALEVSVSLGGQRSLGIEYYHLSNAGLGSINPGQESLVLTLALPVGSAR